MNMIINNIFSIFDPSSSYASSNWLIITIPIIIKRNRIKIISKKIALKKSLIIFISKEVNEIIEKKLKQRQSMLIIIFLTIIIWNLIAIFPYNFTPTAHISISFSLRASIWTSTIIFGWKNKFNKIIIHLTPLGTPNPLMNFIVVIETIRAIIRPITLSIRLSANIVAGHLLITLLSSFSIINIQNSIISTIPTILLTILEIGVAIVQAYVLITLILLYQNETS